MNAISSAALWLVRITGVAQVVLGLFFWNHHALALVPLHMALGLTFVAGVWVITGVAARAGGRAILTLFTAAWAVGVIVLGMTQRALLPGLEHWLIQALHLAVGIGAMVLANLLAADVRRRRSTPPSTHPQPMNDVSFNAF